MRICGWNGFFPAIKQTFLKGREPKCIHILLTGSASLEYIQLSSSRTDSAKRTVPKSRNF